MSTTPNTGSPKSDPFVTPEAALYFDAFALGLSGAGKPDLASSNAAAVVPAGSALTAIAGAIARGIQAGSLVSKAFEDAGAPDHIVATLRIGEGAGAIGQALNHLSAYVRTRLR